MLSPDDFPRFFSEVHGTGTDPVHPFPWQEALLRRVAENGDWPEVLDLPTGAGKTAALDIAVFHLALEADRGRERRAPVRIAFVVDRRLVVDDAWARARRIANRLEAAPEGSVLARVATQLRRLSGDNGPPLLVRRLRGGIPREDDWARTPSQPTILCSTVDQVGSRLLFRGYGVSDSMKPVHAGLIGADCLILLDEAHLAQPFRDTLAWVRLYRSQRWRQTDATSPWGVALLTATPGTETENGFRLTADDREHPILRRRLAAPKPVCLVSLGRIRPGGGNAGDPDDEAATETDVGPISEALAQETLRALDQCRSENGLDAPAVGVVANRVAIARQVFERLRAELDDADLHLLIGPCRPVDRERSIDAVLGPIRTGGPRTLDRPLVLVSTQCIEAGVDIDLDALVTQAAPLDALRQRFGRLNRDGRQIRPHGAVVADKGTLSPRSDDPVYGKAIAAAWQMLTEVADTVGGRAVVDFGIDGFRATLHPAALSPRASAPVMMPAHLDLLSHTAPIPGADPDVSLYLHGYERQLDTVSVVWRADIDPARRDDDGVRRLLMLVPPRQAEAIELPLWAVRRWLAGRGRMSWLADVPSRDPDGDDQLPRAAKRVYRWKGDSPDSQWVSANRIRPGDTIVVPCGYGGVDAFGWNPHRSEPATDVALAAAEAFARRRFAVRIAPGLLADQVSDDALADALDGAASSRWEDVRSALQALDLPEEIAGALDRLDRAGGPGRRRRVVVHLDVYGEDDRGRPRGAVFVAPFGVEDGGTEEEGRPNATEDDASGSLAGYPLSLEVHSGDVERRARTFARSAGLPDDRVEDLALAGYLHDAGKLDARFQGWLRFGDPLGGADIDDPGTILAKSGRPLPRNARVASDLPGHWRHEALSVRLAMLSARFADARDPDLVLWLVGTHHGHGRPFFPHVDDADDRPRRLPALLGLPAELPAGPGPQSLAFNWNGLDWPALFVRLKARYGVWELARMEAILRLADHRASADAQSNAQGDEER